MKSCAAVVLALFACADASADVMTRMLAECGSDKDEELCNCAAGCAVYDGLECDGDGGVDSSIKEVDTKADDFDCDSMKCRVYCLNSLDCMTDALTDMCEANKKQDGYGKDCDVDCDGGVAAGVTFAVAMLVFGAH